MVKIREVFYYYYYYYFCLDGAPINLEPIFECSEHYVTSCNNPSLRFQRTSLF